MVQLSTVNHFASADRGCRGWLDAPGTRPGGTPRGTLRRTRRPASTAVDEGEGHTSVAEWRAGHEAFWHGAAMRAALGDPTFTVDDATLVVLERFRLVERLPAGPDH